jgi:hypothetical protein
MIGFTLEEILSAYVAEQQQTELATHEQVTDALKRAGIAPCAAECSPSPVAAVPQARRSQRRRKAKALAVMGWPSHLLRA